MTTLVAVGACYLDTILTVSHYPNEDEKLRASEVSKRLGGNTFNSLQVLQQLLECEPNEDFKTCTSIYPVVVLPERSSAAVKEIEAYLNGNFNLEYCIYREACSEPASSYITRSQSTGSRTIISYNQLPEMTADEFIQIANRLPAGPKWFHFEGRIPDVTLQCMRYIRHKDPSCKISVEVEKPAREGLQELALEADVVFYSRIWAQGSGYESPQALLHAQGSLSHKAHILCCTWGEMGAVSLDTRRMEYIQSSAFTDANRPVVDTIGAGDTFIAGILYGLIRHRDDFSLQRTMDFANRLAGYKVIQEGFDGLGIAMMDHV